MRAGIDTDGCLRVFPESEIEEYALRKWWEGYIGGGESMLEVVVHTHREKNDEQSGGE